MNINDLYNLYKKNYLIDTDTRKIRKGSIFFALKGDNFNGNKFALDALEKGAKYAIVDENINPANDNVIFVNDVLETLQKLAKYHRFQLDVIIIALTGSNGKTTTKELINAVLSRKYKTTATLGNLNNHIGVPLTLLSMTNETEIGIIEMGANHHKEIAFLSEIAYPDYGYITNFGKAHLEGFGSVQGVVEAKSELYDYILKHHKKVFVNPNDPIQLDRTKNHNKILFDKNISFKNVNPFVTIQYKNNIINTNLIGNYNYNNIAAAITIGEYFDVDDSQIIKAIESYVPTNNRSQIIKTNDNEIILDAYNANPSSMKVAIENFDLLNKKNKILVLGDMFELGKDSLIEHQQIVETADKCSFDSILLIGDNFNLTDTNNLKFEKFESVKEYFKENNFTNCTFLIKGSRGMALEKLVDYII